MSAPTAALTRHQRYLTQALDHVTEVYQQERQAEKARTIYGGLCHSFPILVRTCGLCQALAYVEAKAAPSDDRGRAYRALRRHVAALFGLQEGQLLQTVRTAGVLDYMRYTRTVLDAWIFYKRFAVSILKVDSPQAAENRGGTP